VIGGKVERNEKGEVFCPPYRTGKKVPLSQKATYLVCDWF